MIRKIIALAVVGLPSLVLATPVPYGNPGTINPVTYSFTATGSGDVFAYFVGETAGYGSVIGMRVNGVDGPTGLQNHSSGYGDSFDLGHVDAGDVITFYMIASTSFSGPPPDSYKWYSDVLLNTDGLNHIYSSAYAGDGTIPAGTYVGFEDLPGGGDLDYDDHQFVFSGPFQAIPSAPEGGTTVVLLGLGLASVCGFARRNEKK